MEIHDSLSAGDVTLDRRQKLAIALLVPSLSMVSYAFISLWHDIATVDSLRQKVDEYRLAVERVILDASRVADMASISDRTARRIHTLVGRNVSAQLQLTKDELGTWRDTILQRRFELADDEGVLERFSDANLYPLLSGEAASLRDLLQHEDQAWDHLRTFLEMQADSNAGNAEKARAFQIYEDSLLEVYRQASVVGAVSEAFLDRVHRELREKLQHAQGVGTERRGNLRSVLFHLILSVVGIFGTLFCSCEALGLRLQRKRSRVIIP